MISATHYVRTSGNSKLGPMSATYRDQGSCPTDCPFYANGCYALGRIFSIARKHGSSDLRAIADRAITETPINGVLRFEVSGDVVNPSGTPDLRWIAQTNRIARERPDLTLIRYTHAWRKLSPDMFAYAVNASCETAEDIREARAAGWQTVIVGGADLAGQVIDGSRIVRCPNQTTGITCKDCKVCSQERTPTILFTVHGSGRRKALAVSDARRATCA